jgi:diaminopimelate decarboxylase/aspartate kinase
LFAVPAASATAPTDWWRAPDKRRQLLEIAARESAAYVYDRASLDAAVASLKSVRSVDAFAYAMKANWHPEILRRFYAAGLMLECVSQGELEHAFATVPDLEPKRVLFTPNFTPRSEYEFGFAKGVRVTLDNLHPLAHWPEVFAGREIFVRIDPGVGRGHHEHVRTAGAHSKFGVAVAELDELVELTARAGVRVSGLHAHAGSGIFDVANWTETGALLATLAARFPDVAVVDLGGGIGVPDRAGHGELDFGALDQGVARLQQQFPSIRFWMEPGRFLVARAGVLVAQVTQLKRKGDVNYIGIGTGMNSLIRPALYDAFHEIVNLTRLDEPATQRATIVGPICESADKFGTDRWLPATREGDVLLLATAGAYGYAMASHYNRRSPAAEFLL